MIKKGPKSHFLVCLGITEDFLLLEHIFYIRKTFFLRYFGYMRSLFTRFFTWLFLFLCLCLSLWLCCSSAPQSPSPPSWGGPTAWRRWEWGGVHPHHDVGVDCFQCIITPPHKLVVCGKKGLKNAKKTQNRLK